MVSQHEVSVPFVTGMTGWNAQQHVETNACIAQVRQALENVVAAVREARGGPEHIPPWFVTSKCGFLERLARGGDVCGSVMDQNDPTTTVVAVLP